MYIPVFIKSDTLTIVLVLYSLSAFSKLHYHSILNIGWSINLFCGTVDLIYFLIFLKQEK